MENDIFLGQDFENRAAHPHQEFPGAPPGAAAGAVKYLTLGQGVQNKQKASEVLQRDASEDR